MPTPLHRSRKYKAADRSAKALTSKLHLLAIGIDRYKHWPKLDNAVRDVEALAALLIKNFGLSAEPDTCEIIRDEQATRVNILRAIRGMADRVQPMDSLIIYYAGHGHLDHYKNGYWVPVDALKGEDYDYIHNDRIKGLIKDIPSLHTLLISDACFSGALLVERSSPDELVAAELMRLPSRWAICSGRHDETVADGAPDAHSPFAQAVLDVLQGSTRQGITAGFLGQQVIEQTKRNYKGQLPDYGPIYGTGDKRGQLVLWRNGAIPDLPDTSAIHSSASRDRSPDETVLEREPQVQLPMTLASLRKAVKNHLVQGKISRALHTLDDALQEGSDHDEMIILLQARASRLRREEQAGTISRNDAYIANNRITAAINSLLFDLEEEELKRVPYERS